MGKSSPAKGKRPDKQPARTRYWNRGGCRDKKIRNLLKQVRYPTQRLSHPWEIEHRDKHGELTGVTPTTVHYAARTGPALPRFKSRAEALQHWNKHRQHMGRM